MLQYAPGLLFLVLKNTPTIVYMQEITMAIPSQKDIDKKVKFKESLLKTVSDGRLSEKQMCSILRSSVRQSWMMSPIRLAKIEEGRIYDMDPKTRTKWLFECENCKGKFKEPDIEVDHIHGEHRLLTLADVEAFARSILDVTLEDLQLFCKGCHSIKTYAERHDLTFEEARVEKIVLQWLKDNKTASQKRELIDVYNYAPEEVSNEVKRRVAYRQVVLAQGW